MKGRDYKVINGATYRDAMISAAYNVENNRKAVDALNVFPVPDGDTGTNMSMTITSARKELERLPDDVTVTKVADVTSSAMLRGARGNSGVILSLIFRGISKGLKGNVEIGPREMVLALSYGVESAYKAVMKPTEGTILTVVRLATKAGARFGTENKEAPFEAVWSNVIEGAREALEQTTEMLPVLKKAGVVDAGGQGLLNVFIGMGSVFSGQGIIQSDNTPVKEIKEEKTGIKYDYCVEYAVLRNQSCEKDPLGLRAYLEALGDQLTAKVNNEYIIVHVHTNNPGKVITEGLKYGSIVNVKVDNMRYRLLETKNSKVESIDLDKFHEEPKVDLPENKENEDNKGKLKPVKPTEEVAFVAVAAGEGMKELFKEVGVDIVVSGGQTMNPSTEDILNAVEATPGRNVFILPNNKNIIMSA